MVLKGVDNEIIRKLIEFFYSLGFFSELILFFIITILISGNITNVIFYFIGFSLNGLLNQTLKPILRDIRPSHPKKFLAGEHFMKNSNAYGMPSGHSQSSLFSTVYLFLTINTFYPWVAFSLCVCFAMMIERWCFRNHTISQIIIGAVVGSCFACIIVYLRSKVIEHYVHKS